VKSVHVRESRGVDRVTRAARGLLLLARMADASDFSLRILVTEPDIIEDERAKTRPFVKPRAPQVDSGRITHARAELPRNEPPRDASLYAEPAHEAPAQAASLYAEPAHDAPLYGEPAPAATTLGRLPVASRQKVQRRAALPPPPRPGAEPLSDDELARMRRRRRAQQKMAWARNLLQRFNFDPAL
jgi:hypothetical protein